MSIGQFAVEQAVLNKASFVDVPRVVGINLVAVLVDFDEARCVDLAKIHSVGVDQECAIFAGNLNGDMVENQLIPAKHRKDPVASGEFKPRRPFGFAILIVNLKRGCHRLSPWIICAILHDGAPRSIIAIWRSPLEFLRICCYRRS